MSAVLRVGFIGAGANSRLRHLPGFDAIDNVKLEVVANRSRESSERAAQEFGIERVATDWREVLADPRVDAVCIGTWPDTHAEMAVAALEAGKHVLVEARMARNLAEADLMVAAADRNPACVAQIVPSPFTLNADEAIRKTIRSGILGEIREIVVEHVTGVNANAASPFSWRHSFGISGFNTMALGICFEPLLRWLPGDAEVIAADAKVYTKVRHDMNGRAHDVKIPESLTVLGRWSDGARLLMHHSSVECGGNRCSFRLSGEQGTLVFDANSQQLELTNLDGETIQISMADRAHQGWAVEEQFVGSIRRREPVRLTDFATGRRYMQFTEAVWHAWADR